MGFKLHKSLINKDNVTITLGPDKRILMVISNDLRDELDTWPPCTNVILGDNICNRMRGLQLETCGIDELEKVYDIVFSILSLEY